MSRVKKKLNAVILFIVVAIIASAMIVGCSPQQEATPVQSGTGSEETQVLAGTFVSDEQCLSCHGGSYEANARATADLGDWNPHESIHGGYSSCINCHEEDKVVSHNACSQCHAYAPDEESLFL